MSSSSSMEAYRDRDMEGWSETAREEIVDFDFAMEGDVQRDSRKLRQFTISLTTDHIDPQGEWIKSRRSQAEEIGLCTLTHVNVLRSSQDFYPRAAVFLETKA
ncbi:hypothetical protein EHS25_004674 [Saitozyma podzolica]|uniref:Uncharacterized protein n=1 Tax=Saitozyma podzolica TaxID=1890683 RepID=A0A427YUQ0_9TREE|nr:hypothetical protein EHS25_004674 [Saitozyma podzolica]